MKLKKLWSKRTVSFIVAALLLITQVLSLDFQAWASGSDLSGAPVDYPENCVKKLNVDFSYDGAFHGRYAGEAKSFERTNITKYDSLEYDVYVKSPNEQARLRTYFHDSTWKNANEGRGFHDDTIKTNSWQHIAITSWDTGWGMNGDLTDACVFAIEGMSTGDTGIVVKNVCLTSNDIVSPDSVPDKLIKRVSGSIDLVVTMNSTEEDLSAVFEAVDALYGDYIELDYYVGTIVAMGNRLSLVLKDKNSKRAVYKFVPTTNMWSHLKLTFDDFTAEDGFDATEVCSYSIEGASISDRLYLDNFCITGIAWPLEYPEGIIEKIGSKLDLSKVSQGGKKAMLSYESKKNFSACDFFEFDIYIESEKEEEKIHFFLYDNTYDESSDKLPTSEQRLQHTFDSVTTNEWVHIRTTVADFGNKGTGNASAILGCYLTGLNKNSRYIVVNQCLTNLQVPKADYNYTLIQSVDKSIDYRGSTSSTDRVTLNNAIDLQKGAYLEFDVSVVSVSEEISGTLVLEDENGNTAFAGVSFTSNKWRHTVIKLATVDGISQLSNIKTIYVKNVSGSSRTLVYNIALTDIVIPEMNNKYTFKSKVPIEWDTAVLGERKYLNIDGTPYNLSAEEFLEFDVLFETENENPQVRIFFVDDSNNKGFFDVTTANKKSEDGWYHFSITANDFDIGWGFNGDRSRVVYFALEEPRTENTIFHIKNMCFTYFQKPELDTSFDLVLDTGISGSFSQITGGTAGKTLCYFKGDKSEVDLEESTHIELDVYVDSEQPELRIRCYFMDSSWRNSNTGRGFWDINVKSGEWNHILLDVAIVDTGWGMNGDTTKAVAMMFESFTANNDVYTFHNIAITKRKTLPISVSPMPETPDKASMYISAAEELMSNLGVWNSSGLSIDSRYKTEGKSSVTVTVRKSSTGTMRFLFNNSCDFTSTEAIRFDMLIDDTQLVSKNKFTVQLTSNKRFKNESFVYSISGSDLDYGWNSFDIPITDFTAQDGARLDSIHGFAVSLDGVNLGDDDYFLLGLDNIRAYKVFKINQVGESNDAPIADNNAVTDGITDGDTAFSNTTNDNTGYYGFEDVGFANADGDSYYSNVDTEESEGGSQVTIIPGKRKKIIRRKRAGGAGLSTDMIVLISVSIAGGVLLVTGLALSVLTERKYRSLVRKSKT